MTIGGRRRRVAAALCAWALVAPAGAAQGAAATPDTSRPRYLVPDIGPDALLFDGEHVWVRPVFGLLADYSWFGQDNPSLAQVGEQVDQADLRTARIGVAARLKRAPRLEFVAILDYIEPKRREDVRFDVLDLILGVPIANFAKVTIGKQKQPFVYEMVSLAALLPQQERLFSPFFVSRDVGVRVSGRTARDRVTFWAGWYNDWWTTGRSFAAAGNDYAVRLTGQPLVARDQRAYLHLGVSARYTEAEDGVMRFRGRPESNVTDYYLDTGDIPATHAALVGGELLAAWHQWSILAEWARAAVHRSPQPRARFSGTYVIASWIVTGEHRPYERAIGGARSPIPAGRAGAWEVVARYGQVDVADAGVDGGVLDKWYLGVNWWATLHWKAGAGYGVADLMRDGLEGRTRMGIVRLQWLY